MPPSPGTLEIDLRRRSGRFIIQKLERTTGLYFNIRRARVTPTRSHFVLEVVASGSSSSSQTA